MNNDQARDLAAYIDSLSAKLHPGMQKHHDNLNSLEYTMRAEYDGLYRHMDHVQSIAESLHVEAAARLTAIAKTMGYTPAPIPPPMPQMQINDNIQMPRIVQTPPAQRSAPNPHWPIEQKANEVFDALNTPRQAVGAR